MTYKELKKYAWEEKRLCLGREGKKIRIIDCNIDGTPDGHGYRLEDKVMTEAAALDYINNYKA